MTQLIEALWRDERHTAMAVMRAEASFWPNLCLSLTRDVMRPMDVEMTSLSKEVLACACIMKIVAHELYSHEFLLRYMFLCVDYDIKRSNTTVPTCVRLLTSYLLHVANMTFLLFLREQVGKNLETVLNDLVSKRRFVYWSKVRHIVC